MKPVMAALLDLLDLERLEENLFRGSSIDLGWGQIFGGQVLAQALSAAERTVPEDRPCHSMHGYFMRTGDPNRPVVYTVDPIRDGRSFTTRRVVAIQGGQAIFNMAASFQVVEDGFEHQAPMPDVPQPEDLLSEANLARGILDRVPESMHERLLREGPIEIRPVDIVDPTRPEKAAPVRRLWYRAADGLPDDPSVHRKLLAWASDRYLLGAALLPHGVSFFSKGLQAASLDHAMWFHRSFRVDEWLLYVTESPSASGARGMSFGRFYDRTGRLVASVAQEGLMRMWR